MPTAPPHACNGHAPGCLGSAPHGQRRCSVCTAAHEREDRRRRGSARERGYDAQWERYRRIFLAKHPLCEECKEQGRLTVATVVHHRRDHKGDRALFWDPENHAAVCRPCHDRHVEAGDFGRPARDASAGAARTHSGIVPETVRKSIP